MTKESSTAPLPQRRVKEITIGAHTSAEGLMLDTKFGFLSCEIVIRKTRDVKIDEEKMDAVLEKKWNEIFSELSSLVEPPPRSARG